MGINILIAHNNKVKFDNSHNEIWIANVKIRIWQCQWEMTSNVAKDVEFKITQK